jgi:dihydroneopterin aldolase
VFVRIEKLDRGPGALGVEIVRSNDETAARDVDPHAEDKPHPVLVLLSNAAIASRYLSGWLDQLQEKSAPIILCVGAGDGAAPVSNAPMAQRRIDLLAIEQNAWVLAGRDARCVVVETRTELDWAMKNEQISVWAPSKIILDAVDAPPAQSGENGVDLAQWLGAHIEAARLIGIGERIPDNGDVPVTQAEIHQRLL